MHLRRTCAGWLDPWRWFMGMNTGIARGKFHFRRLGCHLRQVQVYLQPHAKRNILQQVGKIRLPPTAVAHIL